MRIEIGLVLYQLNILIFIIKILDLINQHLLCKKIVFLNVCQANEVEV